MPDLEITTAEASYVFSESDHVTIGRRDDNRVIVTDPTVSRAHAVIRFEGRDWVLEDLSNGRTFYGGQPVSRFTVTPLAQQVNLATPSGPWIAVSAPLTVEPPSVGQTVEASLGEGVVEATEPATAHGTTAPVPVTPLVTTVPVIPFAASSAEPPPLSSPLTPSPPPAQWTPFRSPATGPLGAPAPSQPKVASGAFSLDSLELKQAIHILFPFKSWIDNAGWRQGTRALFLVYAMLPVIFETVFWHTTNVQTLGWVYALYTAPLWLLVFWYLIKPQDSIRTLAIYGAVISVIVLILLAGPLQWWYNTVPDPELHPGNWLGWLIAPGLAEEATKDGAVLITILALRYYFKQVPSVRGCMFLGAIAGLAFGTREAALYQAKDLNLFGVSSGTGALVDYVLEFAERVFVDGLQHAEWAAIACFFIGLGMNYKRRRIPLILFGFLMGAWLHATNDWSTGVSQILWLVVQVLSTALFLGYTLFAPSIEAQVRDTSLFRGESILADRLVDEHGGNPGAGAGGGTGEPRA
jgi:RsiW-degrading membrane proteinase PrsW (M82 family)